MATALSGIEWAEASRNSFHSPPFKDSNDDIFIVAVDAGNDTTLIVLRSTDDGDTFSEVSGESC